MKMSAENALRLQKMHAREDARAAFERKRAERDALDAGGDRKGAWRAHFEAQQIVDNYRKR